MSVTEVIVQALKLCVLTISYAIELAKKREQAIADARARRTLFEQSLQKAIEHMRLEVVEEKRATDELDPAVDEKAKKPL